MDICPYLTKCDILVLHKLCKILSSVIRNDEAFIKHQLRYSKCNRILALSSYDWAICNRINCHYPDIQLSE